MAGERVRLSLLDQSTRYPLSRPFPTGNALANVEFPLRSTSTDGSRWESTDQKRASSDTFTDSVSRGVGFLQVAVVAAG